MRTIKQLLFLLPVCWFIPYIGHADTGHGQVCVFKFVADKDMFYVPWNGNGEILQKLYLAIDQCREEITSGNMTVQVDGYCAAVHDTKAALQLAKIRSNRVKSELIVHKGLREEHFLTQNHATAWGNERNVVVVTLRLPVKPQVPQPQPEPEPVPPPEPERETDIEEIQQPDPVVVIQSDRQIGYPPFSIRTNLLYDALLTPTLGLEWRINKNIGIKLDGSFAHWGSSHGRVQKLWLLNPEVRWYLCDLRRLYVGAGATIGEANIYKGFARILSKETGYQGNIYGGGVTVGYQLPLSKCFSVDFNLGLGYTRFEYDTFYLSNGVRVYKGHDLSKNFWGPTQAGISLVWHTGLIK